MQVTRLMCCTARKFPSRPSGGDVIRPTRGIVRIHDAKARFTFATEAAIPYRPFSDARVFGRLGWSTELSRSCKSAHYTSLANQPSICRSGRGGRAGYRPRGTEEVVFGPWFSAKYLVSSVNGLTSIDLFIISGYCTQNRSLEAE
jgi:hypothetical protein